MLKIRPRGRAVLLALLCTWSTHSLGQDDEVTPPALIDFVEANYPEHAARVGETVIVEFSLTINATGVVTHAELVDPEGDGFDEAALAAVVQFRFSPASRNGQPMAVRIRYRYLFERPTPVMASVDEGSSDRRAQVARNTSPASWTPDADEPTYGALAEVAALEPDVLTRSVGGPILTRIPGTRGDPLRAVEILPGVGRPSFISGDVLVRGAAPGDTQTYFEGMPIPLAFHFGGLTSFAPAPFIERIDFYPGNFSVRYGRRMGGVLDIVANKPERELQAAAELSMIDVRAHAQFPVGQNAAAQVGFRRSTMDLTVAPFVRESGAGFVRFPVYYDWQGFLCWKPTSKDRVRVLAYGSSDRFEVAGASALLNTNHDFEVTTLFSLFHFSWDHRFDAQTEVTFDLQYGPVRYDIDLSATLLSGTTHQLHGRAELTHRPTRYVSIGAGIDVSATPFQFRFHGQQLPQREGAPPQAGAPRNDSVFADQGWTTANRPAAFVESTFDFPRLRVTLGLRTDYDSLIRRWNLDSRLNAALRIGTAWQLRAGLGRFSQPPELWESSPDLGNPDLDWVHAMHSSIGVQYQPSGEELRISVDGFYKNIDDRVVAPTPGEFSNGGIGRIYGAEVSAHLRPTSSLPLFAQLSYTLMHSERRDRAEDPWRLSDADQAHILSLTLSYRLPRGWEVGAGLRVVSGTPYTAVNGALFDVTRRTHIPIYGPQNGERHPLYHRLDVRVEKKWTFASWRLSLFLDIQNVYNRANQEQIQYRSDYRSSMPINGLPIIPSIGLRGAIR